mmetsp:Transcript_5469/g.6918  ORF Transcript_5469/g.6918 Transcript_5469/m.6918 type:complete len:186 (-) Transcript_5469:329-886(-)|eukprot:CAMPEP_0204851692 /NCGR_PEP_ID=MMETSP1347-20130617/10526_1 /ASSEMBLY_ACC=CAM_ASM_000690 /TAXON_ID=215587 /ORGANISM="Aplanochytrium stocchinoi, Strain GSBS06" /LENGTH=185 /DNA_ID=CAMNT_0051995545 /DNA_START=445 /DNA_END=1002 /DNA_ORIENTATION=-
MFWEYIRRTSSDNLLDLLLSSPNFGLGYGYGCSESKRVDLLKVSHNKEKQKYKPKKVHSHTYIRSMSPAPSTSSVLETKTSQSKTIPAYFNEFKSPKKTKPIIRQELDFCDDDDSETEINIITCSLKRVPRCYCLTNLDVAVDNRGLGEVPNADMQYGNENEYKQSDDCISITINSHSIPDGLYF